ncbi:MAG: sugar phosphate nucleotidyltransferase [Proteobacteria bacterium]|nr:sugar phosphate nucleotidyltransferase [Pseudomonadota bacterium]
MQKPEAPHVVILAGGDGNRLASLTRALYGADIPKHFAVLAGKHSLVQTTVERALAMTSIDRISVVVTGVHETLARAQLAPYPGIELLVQPRNLDTAPGILLPLAHIVARSWKAHVIFLPSDHYIANPAPLEEALELTSAGALRSRLSLIGVAPTGPEVEYGWITRGPQIGRSPGYAVDRFVEKPDAETAELLWRDGALWNTFIQAGPAQVFWDLARHHLPNHAAAFERYAVAIGGLDESTALESTYRGISAASFSRDVLAHAQDLAVLPVARSGWSDWGSPRRVFASLEGTAQHDHLVERIRGEATAMLANAAT